VKIELGWEKAIRLRTKPRARFWAENQNSNGVVKADTVLHAGKDLRGPYFIA
jgi:hypothetical protein